MTIPGGTIVSYLIRRAELHADWGELSRLREFVEADMRRAGRDTDLARSLDRMARYVEGDRMYVIAPAMSVSRLFVACWALTDEADKEFWTPEEQQEDALYLDSAMVHPSYSHRGVGRMIAGYSQMEAFDRGMTALRLDCQRDPDLRFHWEALGFTWLRDVTVPGRTSGTLMEMKL
jgi:GNAT superfamily N-acetyltransferase